MNAEKRAMGYRRRPSRTLTAVLPSHPRFRNTFLGSRQIKYNIYSGDVTEHHLPVSRPVRYERPQIRPAQQHENVYREMQHHGSAVGESGGRIEPMSPLSLVERQLKAEARHIDQQSVSRRPAAEQHGSRADRLARAEALRSPATAARVLHSQGRVTRSRAYGR